MKLIVVASLLALVAGQKDPHAWPGRSAIVHLFEWKFSDVALECERWLAPKGYAGVQLSPVNENIIIETSGGSPSFARPWWERYQPVSYDIITRSGDEADFLDMTRRCNDVGIRVYIDVLPNHMAAQQSFPCVGTGGTPCSPDELDYPGVPFGPDDFHTPCEITDWGNSFQVRFCELVGLKDLDQASDSVRAKIIAFLDHLVDLGVAGFRVDAAKHMCPQDLDFIYGSVKDLNTEFGFAAGARPFYYQEVIDYGGGEPVTKYEYSFFGRVTEFKFGQELSRAFTGQNALKWFRTFGEGWGLMPSGDGLVFIDNHDTQRSENGILTYKIPRAYKMAVAFMLSWPHGYPRIMSSFFFEYVDHDQGPPQDADQNIISPSINPDDTCGNGWVCEHRWRQIYNMVAFRNAVGDHDVVNWWDDGNEHVAFSRGDKGFIAFNNGGGDFVNTVQTSLPGGRYCDIVTGNLVGGACTGETIIVNADGTTTVNIPSAGEDGFRAIHVNAKL